ncbi:hypothetical protein EYV94_22730 [Puteibacter caeruleilacunae]|nr:hypothetical protein EYV94_22730 [Puteibacter caeruleilacunae]
MKQSVEHQIKNAFDRWDNKPSDVGFNKSALWASIENDMPKDKGQFPFMKVAVIVVFFMMSGALVYSVHRNRQMKLQHEEAMAELQQQIEANQAASADETNNGLQLNQHKQNNQVEAQAEEPVVAKQPEVKTIIKTEVEIKYQIKEVVPAAVKKEIKQLKEQVGELEKENKLLQAKVGYFSNETNVLRDSLGLMTAGSQKTGYNNSQQIVIVTEKKEKGDFSIAVDKKALSRLSKDLPVVEQAKPAYDNRLKITLTKDRNVVETSAPLFKRVSGN